MPVRRGEASTEARVLDRARRQRVSKPADQRRREILESAARLFHTNGFDATTVQTIAAEAGVAAGTIYLHFASKEAVLTALQDDFEEGLLDRVAAVAETLLAEEDASGELVTYDAIIEVLVENLAAFFRDHRVVSDVIARHAAARRSTELGPEDHFGGKVTKVLAALITEGARRGHVATSDPHMTAYLLNVAAVSAISHAVASGDEAMLDRVVRQIKELYIKALAPHPRSRS